MSSETEVFRYSESNFDTNKYYEYAYCTREQGNYPNTKYYTTQQLKYVGKYVRFESWGWGDGSGCAAYFENNGIIVRIEFDYEGKICFREYNSIV